MIDPDYSPRIDQTRLIDAILCMQSPCASSRHSTSPNNEFQSFSGLRNVSSIPQYFEKMDAP